MGPQRGDDTDGRRRRGEKRRAEIIEATLAVVRDDGAAGVTHRTVAKRAGVPASLSTYYFATLDDLLVAALTEVADAYTARIRELIDNDPDPLRGLARLITESAGPGRERALAERELSTMAARRPLLQPVARRWRDNVAELARTMTSNEATVTALVATADGLCAAILLDDQTGFSVDSVHAVLKAVLDAPDAST